MSTALPAVRVEAGEWADQECPGDEFPATLGAVAEFLRTGLDLGRLTVVVGENGTGKSTVVEGIADAYGLPPGGGSVRRGTGATETPLGRALRVKRGRGAPKHGQFLRSESPRQGFGTTSLRGSTAAGARAHELSHGESFLSTAAAQLRSPGLHVFDEPESGLSFGSCLTFATLLLDAMAEGSQVLLTTHSPVLAGIPGAVLVELDDSTMRVVEFADLDLVAQHRLFLTDPARFYERLLG
ncbi:MAG: AAA family ATPase [Sporichthyaceae bacterium]